MLCASLSLLNRKIDGMPTRDSAAIGTERSRKRRRQAGAESEQEITETTEVEFNNLTSLCFLRFLLFNLRAILFDIFATFCSLCCGRTCLVAVAEKLLKSVARNRRSRRKSVMSLIEPRTLKGFRDYLPEAMIPRERLIATAQAVYRSFGYSPIDTPALEYFEVLAGKGSDETDRQMYAFEDHGGRRVGLRFDLTVPLARFAAQHANDLGLPLKRYHIGTVWRGENTQHGRYREFMQCDFDTIGTRAVAADIETALVIHDLLRQIGVAFGRDLGFVIRLNNRAVLTGLLSKLGLAEKSTAILRSLDKLGKVGADKVADEMVAAAGGTTEQAGH